jgi:hypothetical protein
MTKWLGGCGGGTCIEVAFNGEDVLIRDSKHPGQAPLVFTQTEWRRFLGALSRGEIGRPPTAPETPDPAERVILLLNEAIYGNVRLDTETCASIWTNDGVPTMVTSEVAGMAAAGLLYKSLHTDLWRPTRVGREAAARGSV